MELFINIFNIVLYQPLFNVLVLLYQYLPGHDFGVAVIVLTVLIKFLLYPLNASALKSQKILQELQPKISEIQKKFKNDKEKQIQAMLELYRKEKINPLAGFLPLLIQLPILIALYRVFWQGLQSKEMVYLYTFIPHPDPLDPQFLGVINLAQPNLFLAVLAGIVQFVQTKMITPKSSSLVKIEDKKEKQMVKFSNIFQKQMLYLFPIITTLVLTSLPSALGLYWITMSLFSIIQQYTFFKKNV